MLRYIFSHIWLICLWFSCRYTYTIHALFPNGSWSWHRTVWSMETTVPQCGVLWHGFSKEIHPENRWYDSQHGCQGKVIHIFILKRKHTWYIYIYIGAVCFLFRSSHLIMQNSLKARFFSHTNSFRFAVVFLKKISLQLIKVWWWFRFIHNRWVNQWVQIQKAF